MSTIPIMYQGGSYGAYVSWLIDTMFTDIKITNPFESTGTSHKHRSPVLDIEKWTHRPNTYSELTVKVHPKIRQYHSLPHHISLLTEFFGKSILVYPGKSTYLLHCNNYTYKIWDVLWSGPLAYMNREDLYNNFPVKQNTHLHDVPDWIVREWLSYNFFDSMNCQLEWFLPDTFNHQNCLIVFIDELFYEFEETLRKIQQFIEMPFTKNILDIKPLHVKNILNQKYLNQDSLANSIIASIDTKQSLIWDSNQLTIISQSWLQNYFRQQGYEFRCHGLDIFPNNTEHLLTYLEV